MYMYVYMDYLVTVSGLRHHTFVMMNDVLAKELKGILQNFKLTDFALLVFFQTSQELGMRTLFQRSQFQFNKR